MQNQSKTDKINIQNLQNDLLIKNNEIFEFESKIDINNKEISSQKNEIDNLSLIIDKLKTEYEFKCKG